MLQEWLSCIEEEKGQILGWTGLSTDYVIEQVLTRSIKSTGKLTRGRGLRKAKELRTSGR